MNIMMSHFLEQRVLFQSQRAVIRLAFFCSPRE
jgi:hypothetical protein